MARQAIFDCHRLRLLSLIMWSGLRRIAEDGGALPIRHAIDVPNANSAELRTAYIQRDERAFISSNSLAYPNIRQTVIKGIPGGKTAHVYSAGKFSASDLDNLIAYLKTKP